MNHSDTRSSIQLFENRTTTCTLLKWSGMAHSSYYYCSRTGKRGCKPSTHTLMQDGNLVSNDTVVLAIRFILAEEFVCYGYGKTTDELRENGFVINYKKCYRLMKEHRLLCGQVIKAGPGAPKRKFIKWRVQQASRPMEQLCMDIKYVHIHGQNRNALLLTVLDVYTRSIVGQVMWWQMRKEHVIWLIHRILQQYHDATQGITIRNDNGSQFIAHALREYLHDRQINQEFIHVATPEENCFIEAYHSILQREVMDAWQFDSIEQGQGVVERWQHFYNHRRRHDSLGGSRPAKIWQAYEEQQLQEAQMLGQSGEALSTNGERKSFQIGESRLVDKIFREHKSAIFEDQKAKSAQTVSENPSS